ncbi:flagellin [Laribacter hongkongensis]|uniref:flagellin n=1 Tax=Laribacter hongkongensis TaxID=168471 RepID=UPI0023D849C0|nr:flagellin [Laribacter hongkongensis]
MLGINSNISSLTSQRNLSNTTSAMSTTLQRLSSGLRINSAKDDAAGMAISERMTSQIRGLDQARRNANDGISLAQTAEGALGEIGNNLQRMRELSVQAANGTLSDADRQAVQGEMDQLKNEINRVANQTAFNGTKLLDGSKSGGFTFQVGAEANQTIAITSLSSAKSDALGASKYAEASGASVAFAAAATAAQNAAVAGSTTALTVGGFNINGVEITGSNMAVADNTAVTSTEAIDYYKKTVDAINAKSSETGVTASLDMNATNVGISLVGSAKDMPAAFATGIVVGTGTTGGLDGTEVGLNGVDGTTAAKGQVQSKTGFDSVDVTSVAGANKAMLMLDGAIDAVNQMRGDLGAVQNRFGSVVSSLQTTSENLSASRSRIKDTDFAAETANLSRNQVLQQAGTAMLAQANQGPQIALQLLR